MLRKIYIFVPCQFTLNLFEGVNQDILGLVCLKDCERIEKRPNSNLDEFGRLRVGAAIGAKDDYLLRAEKLIEAGVDVLVVDIANGHSKLCIDAVKELKKRFPRTDVVAVEIYYDCIKYFKFNVFYINKAPYYF